jgi:hypothetical protein
MAGYRFSLQCSLSLVVALICGQVGRSQTVTVLPSGVVLAAFQPAGAASNPTCKVYSLADLGDDPKLCKWVAETIPEMIQPASWKQGDAKLGYYAPSKILVVNNTPAVHTQVDEFLQSLRKSLPQQKAATKHDTQVVPAQFALQDSSRPMSVVQTGAAGYPVPSPPVGPKHLFHFIIRYEGEGIIDSNVAKFTKELVQGNSASSSASYVFPPPAAPPPAADPLLQRSSGSNGPVTNTPPPMPTADAPAPSKLSPPDAAPSPIPAPPPFPAPPRSLPF